jgi:hypothetical protein
VQEQVDRLLDLYLTDDFSKDLLAERRDRLEYRLQRLRSEQTDLHRLRVVRRVEPSGIGYARGPGTTCLRSLGRRPL